MQKNSLEKLLAMCSRDALLLPGLGPNHEAGEHGHAHFGLHFNEVIWQGIDTSTNLSAHGDGILGVLQLLLWGGGERRR